MEGFNANNWVLFNRDIPHVLEKIFLNLDYESYKECLQVNSSWYDLLTSSSYIEKAKANWTSIILDFRKKISKDSNKLWRAARDGNVSKVRTLAPFANVNYVNRGHWAEPDTPLIQAAKMGHKMVIQILLNKGADPNKGNMMGITPLHRAAQLHLKSRRMEVVKVLLDAGADPTKESFPQSGCCTPISIAEHYGHLDIVDVLKRSLKV